MYRLFSPGGMAGRGPSSRKAAEKGFQPHPPRYAYVDIAEVGTEGKNLLVQGDRPDRHVC